MNSAWGVAIPGLAMNSSEIPKKEGLISLQNPEIGEAIQFEEPYTLFDVAEIHLKSILTLLNSKVLDQSTIWIIGMSMGGMINSILASYYRSKLPSNCKFGFLVTTPNLNNNPAIPESLLSEWKTAKPGNTLDFERILQPFFSSKFISENPEISKNYYSYRAMGLNQQSSKAFFRQLNALREFDGTETFKKVDPNDCTFIGGGDDKILGPKHNMDLKNLSPGSTHIEIKDLGHMVNYELPKLFDFRGQQYV